MGLIKALREKSFKVELKKAEKHKRKVKEHVKKIVLIDEMKKRLMKARGVTGLSNAEKEALKIKLDKLEARKKELKKAVKTIGNLIGAGVVDFLQKVDKALKEEPLKKRRTTKKKKSSKKKR